MRRCKRITDTGTKVQSTEALWLRLDSILIAHIPQFDWAVPSPLTGQSILQWIGSCQLKGFRLKHPLSMFEYFRISSGHLYVYSKSTRYSIDIYRSSLECMISQGYSVDIYWTVVLPGVLLDCSPHDLICRNYVAVLCELWISIGRPFIDYAGNSIIYV